MTLLSPAEEVARFWRVVLRAVLLCRAGRAAVELTRERLCGWSFNNSLRGRVTVTFQQSRSATAAALT